MTQPEEWIGLSVSTIYEAAGREGLLGPRLSRVTKTARVVGRARTVECGQDDNLGVHIAIDRLLPGEILVVTMPAPRPVAVVVEILALFAKTKGAVGLMIDAAVRDVDELAEVGLPVWARWITSTGAIKSDPGRHDVKVSVGGQTISPGDLLVLDGDGLVRVPPESEKSTLDASKTRVVQEERLMSKLVAGESTLDLMNLRSLVDPGS